MLVPYYGNKKSLEKTYDNNDYKWIDLSKFTSVLSNEVLKDFEDINWFDYTEFEKISFLEKCSKYPPINIDWDEFVEFKDFFVSAKLLFMTWFTCKYGYRKKGELNKTSSWKLFTHHGIDLIMPKWTPIQSFSKGYVEAAEFANGYGNYVVVKSNIDWENLFFCYEHLDSIKVEKWEEVEKWDIIWTCWNTWNSSWYHLHFQIDKDNWTFHPYWSSWEDDVKKTLENCIDPWIFLRWERINERVDIISTKISKTNKVEESKKNLSDSLEMTKKDEKDSNNKEDFDLISKLSQELEKKEKDIVFTSSNKNQDTNNNKDNDKNQVSDNKKDEREDEDFIDTISQELSSNSSTWDYINFFVNAGILKWDNGDYKLKDPLTRYQITLIIYRLYKTWLLKKVNNKTCNVNFNDLTTELKSEWEFAKALNFVVCNHIITWDKDNFLPWNKLTWEQFLAIIWRLFAGLENSSWNNWYESYFNWAIENKLIQEPWPYIWDFITRKEVFKILHILIFK